MLDDGSGLLELEMRLRTALDSWLVSGLLDRAEVRTRPGAKIWVALGRVRTALPAPEHPAAELGPGLPHQQLQTGGKKLFFALNFFSA
jgi:hypothetical protein